MPRFRRAAVIASAIAAVVLFPPATAGAEFLGGKFPHTPGNFLYLGYTTSGSYVAQQTAAAQSWHSTPTLLYVQPEAYATSEEDFMGYAYDATWWGLAELHPCSGSGCTYTWATLYLNTNTLGSQSNAIRQKVAAHEFGHGVGLGHTLSGSQTSIMRQGSLPYSVPQQYDINNVNALYP